MKLGIQSAILDGLSFEEVIDFASENKFKCVELMCWPKGKADRKYAGVTHIDVIDFNSQDALKIIAYCAFKNVEISALGYYPNPLCADHAEAQVYIDHLKKVIDAAALLGVNMVTTFIGNDHHKNIDDNWPRFCQVWGPLLGYASAKKTKISIENCAMFFSDDEWPAGKNLAHSPKIWRRMFDQFDTEYFGLNYDPSHLVWMQMDHQKPWDQFFERISHAHAKDVKIDQQRLDDVGTMANPLDYHDPRIPGRGDIDWQSYIQKLKDVGYQGALCIEVEDSDYEGSLEKRKQALIDSANHLRPFIEST